MSEGKDLTGERLGKGRDGGDEEKGVIRSGMT